jgi:DNA repair ATPase RecN
MYEYLTKNLKMQLKKMRTDFLTLQKEKSTLEERITVIQSLDHFNTEIQLSDNEWSAKLEQIKNSAQTKAEIVPFLDKIYYRLMDAIKEYQNYKERAFEMKNQRNKYKKLYQDACDKVQEVVIKRDEKMKELQNTIHQLQNEISLKREQNKPPSILEINENQQSSIRVAPGANMNRRTYSAFDPKPNPTGFAFSKAPTTEIPAKRPILIPSMPKRGLESKKLTKPKPLPTSKNVMAWLDRK